MKSLPHFSPPSQLPTQFWATKSWGLNYGNSSLTDLPYFILLPSRQVLSAPFQIINRILSLFCSESSSGFLSDSEWAHMTQNNVRVNFYVGTQGPPTLPSHTEPFSLTVLSTYTFFLHRSTWLIPSLVSSTNSNLPFSERSSLTTVLCFIYFIFWL